MFLPLLAIFAASTALVFVWFKDQMLLGTAEGLLAFYNLSRFLDSTKHSWVSHPGLGYISGLTVASKPTYLVLSFIQQFGLPGYLIQAGVFWMMLVTSAIGIYFLTRELFPNLSARYITLSVFFYWFNPISLVNVWNRFLLNYIFFFGLLPLATYFYIKGLNSVKLFWLFPLIFSIGIYSFTLSSLAFTILLWMNFILLTIFYILINKSKQTLHFALTFFLAALLIFLFANAWWLGQAINFATKNNYQNTIQPFFSDHSNLSILTSLSERLGNLNYIFIFLNSSFYTPNSPGWISFFTSPLAVIINFIIIGVIFYTLISKISNRSILFLGSLLFAAIILAKGSNPPFGEIFQFAFVNFKPLQIFRNPFEKFGFFLVLFSAPLFSISVYHCLALIKSTSLKYCAYFLFLGFIAGVWGFPYFSGLLFTNASLPDNVQNDYRVRVPDYYELASRWLESQGNNFRFLGFPMADEGITYKWDYGYRGADMPSTLFSTPGIMFNTSVPYYSQLVPQIEKYLLSKENFPTIATLLNAKYFLVRKDVDYLDRGLKDPEIIVNNLKVREDTGELKKVAEFGKLEIWENLTWQDTTFYPANSILLSLPESETADLSDISHLSETVVSGKNLGDEVKSLAKTIVIHPVFTGDPSDQEKSQYTFNIPNEGEYSVTLSDWISDMDKELIMKDGDTLLIDNIKIEPDSAYLKNGKLVFGKALLKAGNHRLTVKKLYSHNLVGFSQDRLQNSQNNVFFINNYSPYYNYSVDVGHNIAAEDDVYLQIFQDNDQLAGNSRTPKINIKINPPVNRSTIVTQRETFRPNSASEKAWVTFKINNLKGKSAIQSLAVAKILTPQVTLSSASSNVKINKQSLKSSPPAGGEDYKDNLPIITYDKVNPAKYIVRVKQAQQPFILVFSDLYNPNWKATVKDSFLPAHFLANSYANGWLISKTGNFDVTVEFTPQKIMEAGEKVSLITYAAVMFIIILHLTKKIKPGKR